MVERKFNLDPDWSDDSEEEERKARGMGGAGAIRSATFIESQFAGMPQQNVSQIEVFEHLNRMILRLSSY